MAGRAVVHAVLSSLLVAGCCLAATGPSTSGESSLLMSQISLWQGSQAQETGHTAEAAESFALAAAYMRTSPDAHFRLARVLVKTSAMDAFLEFTVGLKSLVTDFFCQSLLLSNLMLTGLIALGLGMYAAVVILIMRYARTVWYSIHLTYSDALGPRHFRIVALASAVALLVLLSGRTLIGMATWLAVIGCALVWRYASAAERRLVVSFGVFLLLLPAGTDWTARIVSTQHPDSRLRIASLAAGSSEAQLARTLEARPTRSTSEPINEFMRGLLYLKRGDYELAIEHFNLSSKFAPSNAAVLNNLGIALYGKGQYADARMKFEEALRLGPREALVHYNYSQTLNALLRYDLAQEELAKASALDFDLTRALVTSTERPTLIPMTLQNRVLWQLAMRPENKVVDAKYNVAESGFAGILLLVALAAGAVFLSRRSRLPARCDVCGACVRTEATRRRRREVLCRGCAAIKREYADENDKLEARLEERLTRIRTRNTVVKMIVGVLVPGSSHHIAGFLGKGLAISIPMFALIALAITQGTIIETVPQLKAGSTFGWTLPCFLFFYAISAWRSLVLVIRAGEEE